MTGSSPEPGFEPESADQLGKRKRDAAQRLLDWGFAPAVISWVTGCDAAWIEALYEIKLKAPRQQ